MAVPVGLHAVTFSYPLGNTTACSLTQDLPAEGDAKILSLGCGDIRHALFTSHSDPNRRINITCVDHDPVLIARNILMLSLILDGKDNWEIYYHTRISANSVQVILAQAEKLANSAQSNTRIKTMDQATAKKVEEIFKSFTADSNLDPSLALRKKFVNDGSVILSGVRSAAPCFDKAVVDLPKLHTKFWKDGTVDGVAECPNPLFSFSASIMHYGTDPLYGFHLALGYAPIEGGSKGPVSAAKAEFTSWAQTFRKSQTSIEYCWADALSFCCSARGSKAYRNSYSMDPLILDLQKFDVIDTSNLADHLGALNIIIGTSPLLKPDGVLKMELLVMKDQPSRILNELLNGHLHTISSLLGISLVENGTYASASSTTDKLLLNMFASAFGESEAGMKQMLLKFTWKAVTPIILDAKPLAGILHSVYRSMFKSESITARLGNQLTMEFFKQLLQFPWFHRGSFASFLSIVEPSSSNWKITLETLLDLIESDKDIMLTGQYIQDLYLHLHLFGLFTTDAIRKPLCAQSCVPQIHDFWPSSPGTVWITLKVPRSSLRHVINLDMNLGSVPVHAIVESSVKQFQNFFASLQMVFGEIRTTGRKDTLEVWLIEDVKGVKSHDPMFVSFQIPSWILMVERERTIIGFGVQTTASTVRTLMPKLGMELNLFKTTMGNSSNVFVTRNPPNSSSEILATTPIRLARKTSDVKGVIVEDKLQSMVARIAVEVEDEKAALLAGSEVTTYQITPWLFELNFAGYRHEVELPAPATAKRSRIRIARKSSYLELVVPVLSEDDHCTMPPCPMSLTTTGIHLVNMPRVNLNALPALKTEGQMYWLNTHISMSFSASERKLRQVNNTTSKNSRLEFKDSLFSQYMFSSGMQGDIGHNQAIGIVNEASGGLAIIILVDKLRLDVSGGTVLMDVAIFPLLKPAVFRISRALMSIAGRRMCQIKASDTELKMWKQVLPAYVERCRTWSHADTCEYRVKYRVPLSYEPNQQFLCGCGNGKFPGGYLKEVPEWSDIAPFCVRAAMSPCFAVPYIEDLLAIDTVEKIPNGCSLCTEAPENTSLKECGRCRLAKYCSQECQKKDWPKHKLTCRKQ